MIDDRSIGSGFDIITIAISRKSHAARRTNQSEKLGEVTLRRVSLDDLPKAWEIIDRCARALADQGMTHWTDHYSREMMQKLIVHKEFYLAEQDGKHIGTLTFDNRTLNIIRK